MAVAAPYERQAAPWFTDLGPAQEKSGQPWHDYPEKVIGGRCSLTRRAPQLFKSQFLKDLRL
jgi:hypothetical protein